MSEHTARQGFLHSWISQLRQRAVSRTQQRRMQIVEQLYLGNRSIALVRVDGREYLIGGGQDSVNSIVELQP